MSTQQAIRFIGVWRLIPDQSRYEFGPPPQAATYRIESAGLDALRFKVEAVDAVGETSKIGFKAAFGSSGDLDLHLIDADTIETVARGRDQEERRARRQIDAAGRRMTVTQTGLTPEGKPFTNVSVYERR